MNEQKINVCRALASVFTQNEEVTDDEAAFVGRAALDLGLDEGELKLVQQALATPLNFKELLTTIQDPELRRFFFRRIVAAVFTDEHLTENEKQLVSLTAELFDWNQDIANKYVEWMQQGIEWEKKGEEILAQLV